jgi:hypothetical protein
MHFSMVRYCKGFEAFAALGGQTHKHESRLRLGQPQTTLIGDRVAEIGRLNAVSITDEVIRYRMQDAVVNGFFDLHYKDDYAIWEANYGLSREHAKTAALPDNLIEIHRLSTRVAILGYVWTASNFFHWLNQILPSIDATRTIEDRDNCALIVPPLDERQIRSLELLGLDVIERVTIHKGEGYFAPTFEFTNYIPGWVRGSRGLIDIYKRLKLGLSLPAWRGHKLYVSRQDATMRRGTNEQEIIDFLRPLGFDVVTPGAHSLDDVIRIFHGASIVIGLHGQGLCHTAHCCEGAIVYELLCDAYHVASTHLTAQNAGLVYVADTFPQEDPNVEPQHADITVDMDVFRSRLQALLA